MKLSQVIFNEVPNHSTFSVYSRDAGKSTVYRKTGAMTAHPLGTKKENVFYPNEKVMVRS